MTPRPPLVALVSGAGGGIGHAVARGLAERGITVVAGMRRLAPAERGHSDAEAFPGNVLTVELDVTNQRHITRVHDLVHDRFGRLDILINNAGVYLDKPPSGRRIPVERIDPDLALRTMAVNVGGALRLTWAFLGSMRERGYGRIVNVSSGRARFLDLDGAGPFYRTSKVALNALTRIVAVDTADCDILVNAVCPGWVRTAMGGPQAPRSVEDAAEGIIWAALLPSGGPSGGFYRDGRPLDWCHR